MCTDKINKGPVPQMACIDMWFLRQISLYLLTSCPPIPPTHHMGDLPLDNLHPFQVVAYLGLCRVSAHIPLYLFFDLFWQFVLSRWEEVDTYNYETTAFTESKDSLQSTVPVKELLVYKYSVCTCPG